MLCRPLYRTDSNRRKTSTTLFLSPHPSPHPPLIPTCPPPVLSQYISGFGRTSLPPRNHTYNIHRDISSGGAPSTARQTAECGGGKARPAQKRDRRGAEHHPHDVILHAQGTPALRGPLQNPRFTLNLLCLRMTAAVTSYPLRRTYEPSRTISG